MATVQPVRTGSPRRQDTLDEIPDEPPPAYEATPQVGERPLDYGPTRPFQQPPHPPPPQQQQQPQPLFPHPTGPPPNGAAPIQPHSTGYAAPHAPPSNLPPPSFPFWNGANLTPQQTGFSEGGQPFHPAQSPSHSLHYNAPSGPPPPPRHPSTTSASTPVASSSGPQQYAPTTTPVPGQPLLRGGKLLVYPRGHFCYKCGNTGYKNNDPSHPCRKDWEKYAKPYTSAFRLAPTQAGGDTNFQRPLRAFSAPQYHPHHAAHDAYGAGYPGQGHGQGQALRVNVTHMAPPGALVLRPGDPRIGGMLCPECGGRGLVMPVFAFFADEETCFRCHGAGRVF